VQTDERGSAAAPEHPVQVHLAEHAALQELEPAQQRAAGRADRKVSAAADLLDTVASDDQRNRAIVAALPQEVPGIPTLVAAGEQDDTGAGAASKLAAVAADATAVQVTAESKATAVAGGTAVGGVAAGGHARAVGGRSTSPSGQGLGGSAGSGAGRVILGGTQHYTPLQSWVIVDGSKSTARGAFKSFEDLFRTIDLESCAVVGTNSRKPPLTHHKASHTARGASAPPVAFWHAPLSTMTHDSAGEHWDMPKVVAEVGSILDRKMAIDHENAFCGRPSSSLPECAALVAPHP